jgi:hypothetical protein
MCGITSLRQYNLVVSDRLSEIGCCAVGLSCHVDVGSHVPDQSVEGWSVMSGLSLDNQWPGGLRQHLVGRLERALNRV